MRLKIILFMLLMNMIPNFIHSMEEKNVAHGVTLQQHKLLKEISDRAADCQHIIDVIPSAQPVASISSSMPIVVSSIYDTTIRPFKENLETKKDGIRNLGDLIRAHSRFAPKNLNLRTFPKDAIEADIKRVLTAKDETNEQEGALFETAAQLRKDGILPNIHPLYITAGLGGLTAFFGLTALLSGNMKETSIEVVKVASVSAASWYVSSAAAARWNHFMQRLDKGKLSDCLNRIAGYNDKLVEDNQNIDTLAGNVTRDVNLANLQRGQGLLQTGQNQIGVNITAIRSHVTTEVEKMSNSNAVTNGIVNGLSGTVGGLLIGQSQLVTKVGNIEAKVDSLLDRVNQGLAAHGKTQITLQQLEKCQQQFAAGNEQFMKHAKNAMVYQILLQQETLACAKETRDCVKTFTSGMHTITNGNNELHYRMLDLQMLALQQGSPDNALSIQVSRKNRKQHRSNSSRRASSSDLDHDDKPIAIKQPESFISKPMFKNTIVPGNIYQQHTASARSPFGFTFKPGVGQAGKYPMNSYKSSTSDADIK
jgi:hypothetical protein